MLMSSDPSQCTQSCQKKCLCQATPLCKTHFATSSPTAEVLPVLNVLFQRTHSIHRHLSHKLSIYVDTWHLFAVKPQQTPLSTAFMSSSIVFQFSLNIALTLNIKILDYCCNLQTIPRIKLNQNNFLHIVTLFQLSLKNIFKMRK